jgi:hypothetical protein
MTIIIENSQISGGVGVQTSITTSNLTISTIFAN